MEKIAAAHFLPKDFQTAESLKILRTNLMFSGEQIKAVGITSFGVGEGKSVIAFQLAASLAQTGKRVLLLDADLRRSTLKHSMKLRGQVEGLSHCLTGMSNVNSLIHGTDLPGLFMMFAGVRVPNAAELLGSQRFRKLLHSLRDVFDYIVVDTAPLGQVIDSAVIAPELDGTVIVVDAVENSYKMERRIQKQLERSGGKILGVVLNRAELRDNAGEPAKVYSRDGDL